MIAVRRVKGATIRECIEESESLDYWQKEKFKSLLDEGIGLDWPAENAIDIGDFKDIVDDYWLGCFRQSKSMTISLKNASSTQNFLNSQRPHIMPWPKGSSPIQRSSAGSLASW